MPELPEVETVKRGLEHYAQGQVIEKTIIRQYQLRWPINRKLNSLLKQQRIHNIRRRGKYLLLALDNGTLIMHLGMSGRIHIIPSETKPEKHDHVDIILSNGQCLRFTDPRRFGAIIWTTRAAEQHKLLKSLGPEPLTDDFNADYLYQKTRKRKTCIKSLIMNSKIVVGVGNIYANEALFNSKIKPNKTAQRLTVKQCNLLVTQIKLVLENACKAGGTTLKDFISTEGKPGYFQQQLKVYGRKGQPCYDCKQPLIAIRISDRSTVYCKHCQK